MSARTSERGAAAVSTGPGVSVATLGMPYRDDDRYRERERDRDDGRGRVSTTMTRRRSRLCHWWGRRKSLGAEMLVQVSSCCTTA